MLDQYRIGFIGGGNMAQALVNGLRRQGLSKTAIHIVEINPQLITQWQEQGYGVQANPSETLSSCDVWVLAVKPQVMADVLADLSAWIKPNTLVISIAAGITLQSISQLLGSNGSPWHYVVRCMPNTPALIGAGAMGMTALKTVTDTQKQAAHDLMETVGHVVWVDSDDEIDAITALSGSGPAYVFRFIEALVAGGIELGLKPEHAQSLALATLAGATELAKQSTEPTSVLRERVTSKGGTTAAALNVLAEHRFYEIVMDAMKAAHKRAGEMSEAFGRTQSP